MANVDQTERLMISSISQPELALDNAKLIADLPDENKPVVFRGKDQKQVLSIRQDLINLMLKTLGVQTLSFSSSNNNLSGWDLYETILDAHVEIKLGSATDAALGFSHVKSIFGPEAVSLFPSLEERIVWRNEYLTNPSKQRSLYINKLSSTAQGLNTLTPVNTPITNVNTIHSLNMLYANINQQKLMDNIADATLTMPQVYRFSVNKRGIWKQDIRPALTSDNTWVFNGAEVSDRGRLSMKFSNGIYSIRIVYNQKNSFSNKELGIVRAPGIHGLGTPSMNVWVRKITMPKNTSSFTNDNSEKLPSDRIKP
jgi:hypothetical protein